MKSILETKVDRLREIYNNSAYFKVDDVVELLSEKKSTAYWDLSNMVEKGLLKRVSSGKYTFTKKNIYEYPVVSIFANKIKNILIETGYNFYISGIDILFKYMQHIPETYPLMIFIDKSVEFEIKEVLDEYNVEYMEANELSNKNQLLNASLKDEIVIINKTTNFEYSNKQHFAFYEKAFIDVYFEITRRKFPFPIEELVRVYLNLIENGIIDKKVLVRAAYSRSLHYDIRFIVESKNIHKEAFAFVKLLRE